MFPWFNAKPCEEHDWVSYGLVKQCKKCFLVAPALKKMCPTCDGGGHVYTIKDVMTVSMCPTIWLTKPPAPKKCPTCKGFGLVDDDIL